MRRRDFLKGIFGAAAVAAVPAVVLKQIDALPEEPIPPVDAIGKTYTGPIEHTIKVDPESIDVLYIYDEKEQQLIAASTDFRVDMQCRYYPDEEHSRFTGQPEYRKAPPSWSVSAHNIVWKVDPVQVFNKGNVLKCLMAKDNIKFCGEVFLAELVGSGAFVAYLDQTYEARFEGRRELLMTIQKG